VVVCELRGVSSGVKARGRLRLLVVGRAEARVALREAWKAVKAHRRRGQAVSEWGVTDPPEGTEVGAAEAADDGPWLQWRGEVAR
jgi:hypothetical protein